MNINKVYLGSRRGNNDEILLPPTGCQLSLQLILVQVQEEGSLTLELPINCMKSVQLDFYHLQTILCFFHLVVFQLQKCLRQERETKLTPPLHCPNSQSAPAVGC